MKPNFKIDFAKRDFIAMVCFIVVMILVLILGNTFGYVSADDNVSNSEDFSLGISGAEEFYTYSGYQNSSLYFSTAPSYFSNFFPSVSNGVGQVGNSALFSLVTNYVTSYIDSSYSNYVITTGNEYSNNSYFLVSCFDDDTYFYFDPNDAGFTCQGSGHYVKGYVFQVSNGNSISLVYNPNPVEITTFDSSYNGTEFRYKSLNDIYGTTYSGGRLAFGNVPVYAYDTVNVSWPSGVTALWNSVYYFWNNRDTYYVDINYGVADGLVGGSGGIPENDSNNMYLDSCQFKFTFNPYVNSISDDDMKYTGNWNKGNITFNAILNNYQSENITNFSLKFKFQMLIRGTGYLPFNNPNVDQLDDGHVFFGNFFIEQTKSLSELSSGSISWNADSLWSIMLDDSATVNGSNISHLSSFLSQVSEYKEIDWSYFKIYATCYLVSDTEGISDTSRSDSYNFLTGLTTNVSDGLDTNYNPYVDSSTGLPSGDESHVEDSSSSSSTSSNGNMIQNNNQTVTVNNNVNSSEVTNQLDQILGSTGSDDDTSDGGLTDSFLEKTNSNAWLQLMSTTFGFVPASIWIDLGIFLVVVLGILAAFLILRFLLDLL